MIGWEAKASLVLTNAELKLNLTKWPEEKPRYSRHHIVLKVQQKCTNAGKLFVTGYRSNVNYQILRLTLVTRPSAHCVSVSVRCVRTSTQPIFSLVWERERERTSFYHLNCNCGTTRSFCCSLLTGSLTFLHTRVTLPTGVVCAFMSRQRCSLFCETLFTQSSFNTTRLFSHH